MTNTLPRLPATHFQKLGLSCREMCSAPEYMKKTPESHPPTYLKWSKEQVKLPWFDVDRQTADKQCSYL